MLLARIVALMVLISGAWSVRKSPLRLPVRPSQCDSQLGDIKEAVKELLDNSHMLINNNASSPCPCLSTTETMPVAYHNYSDASQPCPSNWSTNTDVVRGCSLRHQGSGCDSVYFNVDGFSYNRVCGRIAGFQKGTPDAFTPIINHPQGQGLERPYVDGLSLTHGAPGSREHIWTFAVGFAEFHETPIAICDCSNINMEWPYQIPTFVGNNYFCETGNTASSHSHNAIYSDDPLWDGKGCGPTSTCCQKNHPPWFCAALPEATSDKLELRLCSDEDRDNEDTIVSFVELHVAFEEN